MEKELIVYTKNGDNYGSIVLPESYYLISENDWIQKTLSRSPHLDGIALLVDWDKKQITCIRKNL